MDRDYHVTSVQKKIGSSVAVKREELKSHVEAVHRDGVQLLLYLYY